VREIKLSLDIFHRRPAAGLKSQTVLKAEVRAKLVGKHSLR